MILYINDHLPIGDRLSSELEWLTSAEIVRVSDAAAVEEFAQLPRILPGMLRRNVSWRGAMPLVPHRWTPPILEDREFDTAYVYNPGFFLSKVVAGCSRRVVMRDSGYANYVRHRVRPRKALPRLLAGRSPLFQTWGEERWIDDIQVVRPDLVPIRVRGKASRITLDGFMAELSAERSLALAQSFFGEQHPALEMDGPTALIVTQPIDQLEMCTTAQKLELYEALAERVRQHGFDVVVKPHPREVVAPLAGSPQIPQAFPIEGWTYLERSPFDLAVSLNSAALSDEHVRFAERRLQLVPPDRFYPRYWNSWPAMIERSFENAEPTFRPSSSDTGNRGPST